MLGNWDYFETNLNGDGTYSTTSECNDRSHNFVNEATPRILKSLADGIGDVPLDVSLGDRGTPKEVV